ncbi:MAG: WG repeat-containing protein [Candidatus Sumerlaeia bacterium]|nr:WG repeat-containing protein [Candidatus Sumerlaeia bacterium]
MGYIDSTPVRSLSSHSLSGQVIFSEGLAGVKINKKFGYIDTSGKFVIKPQYEWGGKFSDDIAVVEITTMFGLICKCGYIDRSGRMVIEPKFDCARNFSEDLAPVGVTDIFHLTEKKIGYINKAGEYVIKPQFSRVSDFCDGVAKFEMDRWGNYIWGYIDKTGKIIWKSP